MRRWWCFVVPVLATGLLLGARPAAAQTVIGNLPQLNDGAGTNLTDANFKAVSFTMGETAYHLSAVRLRLEFEAADTPGVVHLVNDSGGLNPGTSTLVAFQNPSFATGTATYTFNPTTPFVLQPNTKYWLQVTGADSSNPWIWRASAPGIVPTGPRATYGSHRLSVTGGTNWSNSIVRNSFEIQGHAVPEPNAVPEPSAALLFLPALGVVVLARRRRPS